MKAQLVKWLQGPGAKWMLMLVLFLFGSLGATLFEFLPRLTVGLLFALVMISMLAQIEMRKREGAMSEVVVSLIKTLLVNATRLPNDKNKLN